MKCLILVFFPLIIYAQTKLLTGSTLLDNNGKSDIMSGILIENLRSFAKTKSTIDGYFSIPIMIGDTLLFSADFVESRKIIISESIYAKGVLKVHMDIGVIELETVNIGMNKDINQYSYQKDDKSLLYDRMGLDKRLRGLEPKRNISKFKPSDIINPVRLIGHINGYYRKEMAIKNFENKARILNEVRYYFPKEFYTEELKIPEHKIDEFLQYVDHHYNLTNKVLSKQFEEIGLQLEVYADKYLSELNQK